MRIIYLHQYFTTPDMAGGTRSYEMARRLVAAGHEVHMVTSWRDKTSERSWFETDSAGIKVHWLPLPYSNNMGFIARISAFLKFAWASSLKTMSLKGDVIFATSTPLTIAIPGLFASWRQQVPLVFEIRDLWPDVPIALGVLKNKLLIGLARGLERLAYRRSTHIVALAPGMRDDVVAKGIDTRKVSVIPNGCDFDIFDTIYNTPPKLMPNPHTKYKLMYIGTMGLVNDVEFIVRVARELKKSTEFDDIGFYLIGDGKQKKETELLAKIDSTLDKSVHFIGVLTKKEVGEWLYFATATLMTYSGPELVFRDSISNKFFDSIAASKPVIANFAGFSTLAAKSAGAGFIVDRDPVVAAAQICELVQAPNVMQTASKAAYNLAHERFSRDMLAHDLEVVLRDAVELYRTR